MWRPQRSLSHILILQALQKSLNSLSNSLPDPQSEPNARPLKPHVHVHAQLTHRVSALTSFLGAHLSVTSHSNLTSFMILFLISWKILSSKSEKVEEINHSSGGNKLPGMRVENSKEKLQKAVKRTNRIYNSNLKSCHVTDLQEINGSNGGDPGCRKQPFFIPLTLKYICNILRYARV